MKVKVLNELQKIIPVLTLHNLNLEISCTIVQKNLLFTLFILKNHISYQYTLLSAISGVDYLTSLYRFGVIYELLSLTFNTRLRLKTFLSANTLISSSIEVYVNANWWEREVWDMYGIIFTKHPDLRRILTDYGFEGHPMRKDFPLQGYLELHYNENKKNLVIEVIELSQDFRSFMFETPW